MTLDELNSLRRSLPAFSGDAHPSAALLEFCRFYGLEFSAHYPEASYRGGLVESGHYRLMVHRWLQPAARASLLLVHGYYDHSGLFGKLVGYGLSRGYNVVIFDLPGHGLSSGEPAVIDGFGDYARAVENVLAAAELPAGPPLFALAQSTGCAALTECARQGFWPFARSVFLAPLLQPAGWALVQLGYRVLKPFAESLPRRFNRNSADATFLEFLRRDPLQCRYIPLSWIAALKRWLKTLPGSDLGAGPLLLVQGRQDGTVDWRHNIPAFMRLFPGSEVFYLPEAGHQLANESAEQRKLYFAALDQWFDRA